MAKRSRPLGPPESGLFAVPKPRNPRRQGQPRRWTGRTSSGETFTVEEERPRPTFWRRWGVVIGALLLLGAIFLLPAMGSLLGGR